MNELDPVPWVKKTLDFMDRVFWSLKYAGLEKDSNRGDGAVLYARARKAAAQQQFLLGQEGFLNQAFDIAFAIAPDALIQSVILGPLGLVDAGPFTSVGR